MIAHTRRDFVFSLGVSGVALAAPGSLLAAPSQEFTFLFVTDAHIQPELGGDRGTAMAFKKARTIKADFAIQGGDHVFDANAVSKERAFQLYDLYGKTEQDLGLKVHHTLGNHDLFGTSPQGVASATDPLYARGLYTERFGKTYYSFDHKGHHFVVLDSIGITPDKSFEGRIDADQVAWLKTDLAALPLHAPVIVVSHIPLMSAYRSHFPPPAKPFDHNYFTVQNSAEVIEALEGYNVLGVLQGHTHINETIWWKGVPYITSGAVCGDWWKGAHVGIPEGFTVVTVAGGKLTTRYETYGWKAVKG
ncbi:3',5'-cyclic AMP phosphodiesterase CpdA [Granulicella rosea]|uniref:3',5'-cyclic AMP phosphodiesterase CpdA n=1 Tax=Granulicella rosea TaxID=474952 RepID=A0A239KMF3_9BACT|nr:metallophosphoesterase [Granulicella rosea]SNT18803.1 3',5'-cyclic AMP phosphodiesterase CpdA [Granulicella rosea]